MNSLKRNYELALEALEELTTELVSTDTQMDKSVRPPPSLAPLPLDQILAQFGTLPRDALFLGAAYDGLPILLNLNDPTPGPILIAGDQGSGKTALLQTIAEATPLTHTPKDLQFGIITKHPEEWEGIEEIENCMGIFPAYHNDANNFILSLADWAHNNHREKRFALLLIDDLETVAEMNEKVQQSLRWLLLRGPNRRVWTFVTLNAGRTEKVLPWLNAFRTRLFGMIENAQDAVAILPTRDAALHLLQPGLEFILNENRQWVKFWIPPVQ
ncbi:MAG: hypothetical protein DRI32_05890 [Chloroflexi bacterium]|nr:MAG: hypothetical protein B5M51_00845 [Anaerolinea sp. 4484_236]RLD04312.1 MAG: hypothetical protein DRI32_05890 [Chloroflexota bacterium]